MSARDVLYAKCAAQSTADLCAAYRMTDDLLADRTLTVRERLAVVTAREGLTAALEAKHPGVLDAWCARLDAGATDAEADLIGMYEDAAR